MILSTCGDLECDTYPLNCFVNNTAGNKLIDTNIWAELNQCEETVCAGIHFILKFVEF